MKTLKNLKKGDKVAVLSTARKVSMDEIKFAITIFESWGLVVELAENLFEEDNQFAGTVSQRTQDLQNMINRRDMTICLQRERPTTYFGNFKRTINSTRTRTDYSLHNAYKKE